METVHQTDHADDHVYEGFWTDWTHGPVFGATITLSKRDGSLLIALIALFVGVVGTSFWRICCFALHQLSSTCVAQDALYHQRQAIFRNSATGASGLWRLLNIWLKWRKTAVDRPLQRLLPAIGLAICCVLAFGTAGTFSSKISTADNGVLIRSPACGIVNTDGNPNVEDILHYYLPWVTQIISSWSAYAQNCYLNISDLETCHAFIQPQLPSRVDRNASCPFRDGICESEFGNIVFKTSLDSHSDLGLNAPPDERILLRRVTSCAPIKVDGYRTLHHSHELAMDYERYYYGHTPTSNYTYEYPRVTWNSEPDTDFNGNGGVQYTIQRKVAYIYNGTYGKYPCLYPIPALGQQDADVSVIFLAANTIAYTNKVSDPWYAATRDYIAFELPDAADERLETYRADKTVSVLACTVKEQYCNQNIPSGEQCSPYGGTYESSLADDIWTTSKQRTAFRWVSDIFHAFSVTVSDIPGILRERGLLASSKCQNGLSGKLPSNQWQQEVESWHAASLVALQGSMTQVAKGTSDENLKPFKRTPNSTDQRNLCNSQKIPAGSYTNFSVFGLCFTLVLGSFIISMSYAVEPLTAWVQKRRASDRANYARLEWITHETLQLQRQVYEQSGIGDWEGCASSVPVTSGGETLGVLDLENPDCPRLRPAQLEDVVIVKASCGDAGSAGNAKERRSAGQQRTAEHYDNIAAVDDSSEVWPENSVTDVSSIQSAQTYHTEARSHQG